MEFDLCIQDDVEFSKSLAWVTGGVGGIRRGGLGPAGEIRPVGLPGQDAPEKSTPRSRRPTIDLP